MSGSWELETITPERAAALLDNRGDNIGRMAPALEAAWMDHFAGIIQRGEWQVTPQGIAIGKNGMLFDGVHRCGGIVKSGIPVEVWVYRDENVSSVHMLPIDRNRTRADHFIIGAERKLVSVAKLALKYHIGNGVSSMLSEKQIKTLVDAIREDWVAAGCDALPTRSWLVSSPDFQLASTVHIHNHTASAAYLRRIADAIHDEDLRNLPPFVLSFVFQYKRGRRWPSGSLASVIYRALTEKFAEQGSTMFKATEGARSTFTQALRAAYHQAMPLVKAPVISAPRGARYDRRVWTDEERQLLRRGSREGWSAKQMAVILRRTEGAVRQEAFQLGYSVKSIKVSNG